MSKHLNGNDLLARISRIREPNHLHRLPDTTSGYSLVYTGTLIDEITVGTVSRTRVRLSVSGEDNIKTLAGLVDEDEQWWPNPDHQHEWESGRPASTDLWWFMDVRTREPSASREISVLYDVVALLGRLLDGKTDPLTEAAQDHAELDQVEADAGRLRYTRDSRIRASLDLGATLADAARRIGVTEQAIARIRDRGPRES